MQRRTDKLQIFFLGLIMASAGMILFEIWGDISTIHHVLIPILLPLPYVFTYLAASMNANPNLHITPSNHAREMAIYPYDYVLFHPGIECRTCEFQKPARSKHCSICKACISRADHHCVWVNNCLGRGNYRWFLALLLSTSVILFYGASLAYIVLMPQIRSWLTKHHSFHRVVYGGDSGLKSITGALSRSLHGFIDKLQIAINLGGLSVAGVGLLASLTAPLPLGLLAYHIYLIWAGTTTNESGKWSDWKEDMKDGIVWLADLKTESTGLPRGVGQECRWPIISRQCMVQTSDGQMPRNLPPAFGDVVEKESWRRVWRLAQIENIYDLGFWDNLMEVILN